MPVVGREYTAISNLITNLPTLPLDILKGQISVDCSFEEHPSGSITIEAVSESDITEYRKAYNAIGKPIHIYGYSFRISNYSETRFAISEPGLSTDLTAYNIAVNLEGFNATAVEKPIYVKRQNGDVNRLSLASSISLNNLAKQGGIKYSGFNNEISIPSDQGADYNITFASQVTEKLRENGKFIDYSNETIRLRDLNQGSSYIFTDNEILDSIETSVQKPIQFDNTRLEGKDGILAENEAAVRDLKRKNFFGNDPFVKKPPLRRKLREGDLNPTQIPADLGSITSLDLTFDSSGPRKSYRETEYLNNKLISEVSRQYGLVYLANDIKNPLAESISAPVDTPALLSYNPQAYWKEIEYKKTTYVFKKLTASARIQVRDSETGQSFSVLYLDEVGKSTKTTFSNKYLVQVVTNGWRLGRFTQESLGDGNSDSRIIREELDSGDLTGVDLEYFRALWESIQYRKIPITEIKYYYLEDPNNFYEKSEEVPFETQKAKRSDIGLSGQGEVVIATPSRNYVYPMMVLSEISQTHAFARMDNPENIYIRNERKLISEDENLTEQEKAEELRILKLLEDLSTGEDTYSITRREIQPSKNTRRRVEKNKDIEEDSFIEYSSSASSQDSNFKASLQNMTYRETLGRPGNPEVLQDIYVKRSELNSGNRAFGSNSSDSNKTAVYYITGKNNTPFGNTMESISVNTSVLPEALKSANTQLALQNFLSTSEETMTLAWFYPDIKPGDFISSVDTVNKSRKRVKSVSFSLNYQGFVGNQRVVTCDGTSVTLGIWHLLTPSDLNITKTYEGGNGDLDINANFNASQSSLGEENVFARITTRRNRPN